MKLTKKLETQIRKAYHTLWDANLKGDINTFASFLDSNVTVYGTAAGEIFTTKKQAVKFYKATADQMTGKADFRKRKIGIKAIGDTVVINEQCDLYVLADAAWMFYGHARITAIFEQKGDSWKVVHMHGSFPDSRTGEGEQLNTDKIKEENIKLRDAVRRRTEELEHKNRELEIETALEKVRTVAMSMKQPADMPEVCKTISLQLQSLGVKEIRNVQTAIFYESRGTYMNYEYYARHKKTIITETLYTNHKIASGFAKKMLQGKGEIFITHIKGKKVKDWLAYQQTTNVFIDRFLEKAGSLHYYWHSLGPVALGVSTYAPLSKEELSLFNRFLNVFELAYTRYLDIEQALAQAKEAKIEASLERVRAVAMGMHKPGDLLTVSEVLFVELEALGFSELRNAMINIFDDERGSFVNYDYSAHAGKTIANLFYNTHPVIEKQIQQARASNDAFSEAIFAGKDLEDWKEFRRRGGEADDPRVNDIDALYYYFYSIGTGVIGISTYSSITEEKRTVLKRFRNVFDLAYRRFMDIQQAETQAREAQIEAALERVRSRSMGMQKSEELKDVIKIVYQQLIHLKINLDHAGFVVDYKPKGDWTFWIADEQDIPSKITHPYFESVWANQFNEAKETGADFFVTHLNFEEKNKFYRELLSYVPGLPETARDFYLNCPALAATTVLFKDVSLYMENFSGIPYSNEENKILMRFGKVFQQTFTRFRDLEKAEAQAREAQIEAALERVRSKTMAMHNSNDVGDTVTTMFSEFVHLGISTNRCGIIIFDDNESAEVWTAKTVTAGKAMLIIGKLDLKIYDLLTSAYQSWKDKKPIFQYELQGDDLVRHYEAIKRSEYYPIKIDIGELPQREFHTEYFFPEGAVFAFTAEPISEEHSKIMKRFAGVFGQTYRRYLDLQKAEAQAREAQIEAALERVRSRSLAMHHSDELREVIGMLYKMLSELKVKHDTIAIQVFDFDNKSSVLWPRNTLQNVAPKVVFPYDEGIMKEDTCHRALWEAMATGKSIINKVYTKQQKDRWFEYIFVNNDYTAIEEHSRQFLLELESLTVCFFPQKYSGLYAESWDGTKYSADDIDVLKRAARVFEQAYVRFLDLQKAEAQAREAKIEAALEKVRSRTMAMQKSEELSETSFVLFQQLKELGEDSDQTSIGIFEEDDSAITIYSTTHGSQWGYGARIQLGKHSVYQQMYSGWKNNLKSLVIDIGGGELEALNKFKLENPDYQVTADDLPKDRWIIYNAFFSNGTLAFCTTTPRPNESIQLFERFAQEFDHTYRRFLDLQKAEAQAREAQIEAALERVRSRTMAMHKSDELADVAILLFKQVSDLGIKTWTTGFNIWSDDNNFYTDYITNPAGGFVDPYTVDASKASVFSKMSEAKKRGDDFLVNFEEGKELEETYRQLIKAGEKQFKGLLDSGFSFPTKQYEHVVFGAKVSLLFITYEPVPEAHDIFKRFGKVFEQTYTRFLDLQKAEAQARESQIQLALERVRARTMAMHKSDELPETSHILFEQMKELGEPVEQLTIGIVNEENRVIEISATLLGDTLKKTYSHSIDEPYMMAKMYKAWKKQQKTLVVELRGDELNAYNQYRNELTNSNIFPTDLGKEQQRIVYAAFFSKGMLALGANETRPPESLQLLVKFASVFDLTYTRFLDLQKAEAQAREAQIEASLERVRARTMAMHNSEDVSIATATMFIELEKLGIENFRGGILNVKENKTMEVWSVNKSADSDPHDPVGRGKTIRAAGQWDMTLHPWWRELYKGWINKDEILHYFLAGKENEDYVKILNARRDYIPGGVRELPDCHIQAYYFGEGAVWTFSLQPHSDEDKQVMKKFASVFSLTFRRYQDLKKAEAQAREAQIEAALERVRTSAMAMQKSDDLFGVAGVLWEQLKKLGQAELESSIVHLYNNDQPTFDAWYAYCPPDYPAREMITGRAITSKSSTAWAREVIAKYQSPETTYTIPASGEKLSEWYREIEKMAPAVIDYDENGQIIVPDILYYHFSKFSGGALLMIANQQPSPEACDLQKRAAVVFDLAYTRFLDLKNAETQAKEAIKQATLDRIRADIASMRTVADLDKITPLIWNELNILGISFIRCGVFIMDETQRLIHTFLSSPDGKAIAAFHLPYDTTGNLSKVLSHWKDDEKYIDHWDQFAFTELADILVKQGAIASPDQYLAAIPQGGFYLHFLPFLQGMLYVGSLTELVDEEIRLLQSVADAFSTAYARYEDFNKLEAAKQQVDKTLVDLKQAQTQLVQSEKMASLGELTAGIAHEIQNPLNFVNNFSEVSAELLDEMIAELGKGNRDDAVAIADDVKQNLEKILHHGKRADGIVKGMLQHSRSSTAVKEPTDINKLADEYLRLAYHGLRAKDKSFNAVLNTDFDESIGSINLIPQDIGRAVLNLITNAFYAVGEKRSQVGDGYEPTIFVSTRKLKDFVEIIVGDNGNGIPPKVLDKIFQPFFTTKPTGQGTGLGLSLAYDIVKAHGGELKVETKIGGGSEFIIQLQIELNQ